MMMAVFLVSSLALSGPRVPRAGYVSALALSGPSVARAGYAIHAHYVVPTDGTIPPQTKMPDMLVALNATEFPSLSRARKALRRGAVLVNGQEVRCIATAGPGDVVELQQRIQPGFAPRGVPPFPVRVLFEDTHIAVVNKPAGVVTHPPPGGASGSRSMRTAVQYALQPPAEDAAVRAELLTQLQALVARVEPEAKLFPFGSSVSGLASKGADLDLTLMTEESEEMPIERQR